MSSKKGLCPDRHPKCDGKENIPRLDGTCNNLKNGLWGSPFIALRRYLPARYSQKWVWMHGRHERKLMMSAFSRKDEHSERWKEASAEARASQSTRPRIQEVNVFNMVSLHRIACSCDPNPGAQLPSPRLVLKTIYGGDKGDKASADPDHTSLLWQFGQFLVHDISQTPESPNQPGQA